jgi:hypothetical protein
MAPALPKRFKIFTRVVGFLGKLAEGRKIHDEDRQVFTEIKREGQGSAPVHLDQDDDRPTEKKAAGTPSV